jgi:hypothetical protein
MLEDKEINNTFKVLQLQTTPERMGTCHLIQLLAWTIGS